MATKETVAEAIQLMATIWRFPSQDLKATAAAYYHALRDLSDEDIQRAVSALTGEWGKTAAPKPADIRTTAADLRPLPPKLPRPVRHERTHDEVLHKLRCDTYAATALQECDVWEIHPDKWTLDQRRAVATRQHEMREELGLPHPDLARAELRKAWATSKSGLQT